MASAPLTRGRPARGALALLVAILAGAGCRMEPPARPLVRAAGPVPFSSRTSPEAARAIRALRSEDFAERSRAAEALVAMGEDALPALGEAGDLIVPAHGRVAVSATRPVVAEILAAAPEARLARVHLVAGAPNVRRAAAAEIGVRGGLEAVPFLIERLADEDAGVRVAAAASLRRVTNRVDVAEGPARGDSRAVAAAAAARWRGWWSREGRLEAAAAARRKE